MARAPVDVFKSTLNISWEATQSHTRTHMWLLTAVCSKERIALSKLSILLDTWQDYAVRSSRNSSAQCTAMVTFRYTKVRDLQAQDAQVHMIHSSSDFMVNIFEQR